MKRTACESSLLDPSFWAPKLSRYSDRSGGLDLDLDDFSEQGINSDDLLEAQLVDGLTRVPTIGGGQCAFGGFACGLVDHVLLNQFDARANSGHFQSFLDIFRQETGCDATWPAFKNYLRQNLNLPMELQRSVAKSLRKLLVQLRYQQHSVSEAELEVLRCAFAVFVRQELNLPNRETGYRGDDIYSRHKFMMDKFSELLSEFNDFDAVTLAEALALSPVQLNQGQSDLLEIYNNVLSASQVVLVNWYIEMGCKLFTQAMADDSAYAGDLELTILAQFWKVTFKAERTHGGHKFVHTIHADFGRINSANFTEQQIRLLKNFGIVDRREDNEGYLLFFENTRETVRSRLAEILHADMLDVYWQSWQENRAKPQEQRTPLQLSNDFTDEMRRQLFARDLLVRHKGEIYFPVELSDEEFRLRLRPFTQDEQRQILQYWDEQYRPAPEIRCANDNALHWEYCQPEGYPWQNLRRPVLPTLPSMSSLLSSGAKVECADPRWAPLQNDAYDLQQSLLCAENEFDEFELAFYGEICKKLDEIIKHNVITKSKALLFIQPSVKDSSSRNNLCIFRQIYHCKILAAAFEELIDNLSAAKKSLQFIMDKLTQHDQAALAKNFLGYAELLQAIKDNLGEQFPLIQHVALFEVAHLSGQDALDRLHNWPFCDHHYQQHLSQLRVFMQHLKDVMQAASIKNIALAIVAEMTDYDLNQENLLYSFVERLSNYPESLVADDQSLLDLLKQQIGTMVDFPVLQETLQLFMERLEEHLALIAKNNVFIGSQPL